MRSVFSIPIPEPMREALDALGESLRTEFDGAHDSERLRWIEPEHLHVTLKYLGELPPSELPVLIPIARAAAEASPPFILRARRYMRLGGRRQTLIGLAFHSCRPFSALADRLEGALIAQGFCEPEKSARRIFLPLARMRRMPSALGQLLRRQLRDAALPGEFSVDGFELLKSQLHRRGAAYHVLERFALGEH